MIRVTKLEDAPFDQIAHNRARRSGGSAEVKLDLFRAYAEGLSGCEALVVAGDLHGRVRATSEGGGGSLLGVALAARLKSLAEQGVVPQASDMGVVLTGDYYIDPAAEVHGSDGDVSSVWQAFSADFRWVVGVLGNHDELAADELPANAALLDGTLVERDGIRLGGVGLAIGGPERPGRRQPEVQLRLIDEVLALHPDVLVLHQGPPGGPAQRGKREIGERLRSALPLTVCGHYAWDHALAEREDGLQILNVDARVVILMAS
jgi:hypothetical protein